MLVDTHCHIHEPNYPLAIEATLTKAAQAGVKQFICVGTSQQDSVHAIAFAEGHDHAYASIGVHPHETKDGWAKIAALADKSEKIVSVGEIGLDYFYTNSPRQVQLEALKDQIKVALDHNLPIIFHVREAFDDFWPLFDQFTGIRGVLHSFTDTQENLQKALKRGLYIGVNGISTFTKSDEQKAMFDTIPLDRLLFETDAPFLTPYPFRGTINEPAFVRTIAEFHANRRGVSLDEIASATTANARELFAI